LPSLVKFYFRTGSGDGIYNKDKKILSSLFFGYNYCNKKFRSEQVPKRFSPPGLVFLPRRSENSQQQENWILHQSVLLAAKNMNEVGSDLRRLLVMFSKLYIES
jgi:hypothetical protein